MYNMGDETVVERYLENPYWQHFCGEIYFQYNLPFDPSDFVHFRHRIGKDGMEKIFKQSIDLFGSEMIRNEVKEVRVDTTVQEKNITYPTDRKLYEKAIEHCKKIANTEGLKLKRTYTREIKKLRYQLRFSRSPKDFKKRIRLQGKLHRIAVKIYSVVRQCKKADPQMAHLVFADTRVSALKTKRAIFCERTERLSDLKM